MIDSANEYRYVTGDLDKIIINGEIMPLREGDTASKDVDGNLIPKKNIIRGEDITFLTECWGRYNELLTTRADWPTTVNFSRVIAPSSSVQVPGLVSSIRTSGLKSRPSNTLYFQQGSGTASDFLEEVFGSHRCTPTADWDIRSGGILRRKPIEDTFADYMNCVAKLDTGGVWPKTEDWSSSFYSNIYKAKDGGWEISVPYRQCGGYHVESYDYGDRRMGGYCICSPSDYYWLYRNGKGDWTFPGPHQLWWMSTLYISWSVGYTDSRGEESSGWYQGRFLRRMANNRAGGYNFYFSDNHMVTLCREIATAYGVPDYLLYYSPVSGLRYRRLNIYFSSFIDCYYVADTDPETHWW